MFCFKVYCCRPLALAFLELTVVRKFHEYTHQHSVPPPLRAVLGRLSALYALWSLSQHMALLYQGEAPVVGTCLPALSRTGGDSGILSGRLGLLVRRYLHVHSLSSPHGLEDLWADEEPRFHGKKTSIRTGHFPSVQGPFEVCFQFSSENISRRPTLACQGAGL